MDVATPLTFEERGGRSEGAVAGWSWDYTEASVGRARELIRTPIKGLYMAGYQAYSMLSLGGIPSAMRSGLMAAQYLLEGKGPTSGLFISH
jgi:phytoene dehydrogenase-like protein